MAARYEETSCVMAVDYLSVSPWRIYRHFSESTTMLGDRRDNEKMGAKYTKVCAAPESYIMQVSKYILFIESLLKAELQGTGFFYHEDLLHVVKAKCYKNEVNE